VTRVGRGTKVDNLVQLAHNVEVGPLSLVVAQVGIAGSTKLGMGVVLGGQVGVIGHLHIGDGVRVGAQSGVLADIPAGETFSGHPARPHREWLKTETVVPRLPEMRKQLRELQQKVERLETALAAPKEKP
ncbi:MAG TPA: UDP-3-O-(3-hydroxymyristoyl)glucosamine N-acyltransferase, partial [Anaeromyxobacteraceae bacterium]|nr:UDP-3-O-(3-hydroxymyristoyl)glucosamine N-acyltransferase [Anaeromyxobacteraceae bacterium]